MNTNRDYCEPTARHDGKTVFFSTSWEFGVPWNIDRNEIDFEALLREEREKRSRHLVGVSFDHTEPFVYKCDPDIPERFR